MSLVVPIRLAKFHWEVHILTRASATLQAMVFVESRLLDFTRR